MRLGPPWCFWESSSSFSPFVRGGILVWRGRRMKRKCHCSWQLITMSKCWEFCGPTSFWDSISQILPHHCLACVWYVLCMKQLKLVIGKSLDFYSFRGVSLNKPFQNDRYLLANLLVCKKFATLSKSLGDFWSCYFWCFTSIMFRRKT